MRNISESLPHIPEFPEVFLEPFSYRIKEMFKQSAINYRSSNYPWLQMFHLEVDLVYDFMVGLQLKQSHWK